MLISSAHVVTIYSQTAYLRILLFLLIDYIYMKQVFVIYVTTQTYELKAFYTPPLKKVRGIMLYPPKKICVRVSVRPSVCPSVRLSVRQRFVSVLYLEQLLTDFLQTLYRSSYQEGMVWD